MSLLVQRFGAVGAVLVQDTLHSWAQSANISKAAFARLDMPNNWIDTSHATSFLADWTTIANCERFLREPSLHKPSSLPFLDAALSAMTGTREFLTTVQRCCTRKPWPVEVARAAAAVSAVHDAATRPIIAQRRASLSCGHLATHRHRHSLRAVRRGGRRRDDPARRPRSS
eukprot:SAG25_NODE_1590_length_2721_cov_2.485889_3_plen_171_part_00